MTLSTEPLVIYQYSVTNLSSRMTSFDGLNSIVDIIQKTQQLLSQSKGDTSDLKQVRKVQQQLDSLRNTIAGKSDMTLQQKSELITRLRNIINGVKDTCKNNIDTIIEVTNLLQQLITMQNELLRFAKDTNRQVVDNNDILQSNSAKLDEILAHQQKPVNPYKTLRPFTSGMFGS